MLMVGILFSSCIEYRLHFSTYGNIKRTDCRKEAAAAVAENKNYCFFPLCW